MSIEIEKIAHDFPAGVFSPTGFAVTWQAKPMYRLDSDGALEKRCSKCRDWWPADTEFFPVDRAGLGSWCRACRYEHRKQKVEQ